MLIAVCVLSPAHLEHVLCFTSFRLRFGGVLRGRFVPRTCFDRVLAGTVLVGTRLFRTHSDFKKWCVPRTCSRWNCTEKCERLVNVLFLALCITFYSECWCNKLLKCVFFTYQKKIWVHISHNNGSLVNVTR